MKDYINYKDFSKYNFQAKKDQGHIEQMKSGKNSLNNRSDNQISAILNLEIFLLTNAHSFRNAFFNQT